MKAIKEIVEHIREQMDDAEEYARLAYYYNDDNNLKMAYSTLARQELDHADRLHGQAVRIINDSKQSGKEVPKEMLAVWDWEHELAVNDRAGVEALLSKIK